ncbi:MAG: hypothetical protein COA88_06340 [Kordia sp.]|nr:MAG: hypothetical protein COA88_06340 [Kordia sp.]
MKIKKLIVTLSVATILLSSCSNDESIDTLPLINSELSSPNQENEKITIHIVETDDIVEVNSIEEAVYFIENKYSDKVWANSTLEKIQLLKNELDYSKNLNLEDPTIEEEYAKHIKSKYSKSKISTSGILWDNSSLTGFLSVTTVPFNLKSSKVNRASAWQCITPGAVILCDKKWFRGKKVIVVGLPILSVQLGGAYYNFDNQTDSFF